MPRHSELNRDNWLRLSSAGFFAGALSPWLPALTILAAVILETNAFNQPVSADDRFEAPVPITVDGEVLELADSTDRVLSPALADWDGDGRRDLLLGNNAGRMRIYRNLGTNGRPQFSEPVWFDQIVPDGTIPLGCSGASFRPQWVDFDGDGDLDLVTCSDDCCDVDGEFFLYRRGADGQFQTRESIRMTLPDTQESFPPMRTRVFVADWNRDGNPNLIMHINETHGLWLDTGSTGDRREIELSRLIGGSEPVRVISTRPYITDWDGDGLSDIIVGMTGPEGWGLNLLRRINNGEGSELATPVRLVDPPDDAHITGVEVADWDQDGRLDVIIGLNWYGRKEVAPRKRWYRSQVWVYVTSTGDKR